MTQRKIPLATGEYFHIYNRGNSKQAIFKDDNDYQRFKTLLYISNGTNSFLTRSFEKSNPWLFERGEQLVDVGIYCLMPNHFHILLLSRIENGISTFIRKLSTSYSMYFNNKYERQGGLFESRFKAQHADTDEYLKYLYAYIHLNPVKLIDSTWKEEGIKDATKSYDFVASFAHSSLPDYLGDTRPENAILNQAQFPKYFSTHNDIKSELLEWLNYDKTK